MKTKITIAFAIALSAASFVFGQEQKGQVDAFSVRTRDGSYHLQKEVPSMKNPVIRGDGMPTKLFVVQLARFEDMIHVPPQFPKGTMLWVNPDIPNEKILLAGYYASYEEATEAAKDWKKRPEFKGAFARKSPFVITYQ